MVLCRGSQARQKWVDCMLQVARSNITLKITSAASRMYQKKFIKS